MNKKRRINHNYHGDNMIYFLINVVMYLIMIVGISYYYKDKMNLYSFLMILFNMNIFFLFLDRDINFIYGFIVVVISILVYHFPLLFKKEDEEIILIKNGNISFRDVINHYSLHKLINYLKRRRIKIDEVAFCIKNNNHLTIIKNKDIQSYPVSIIIDGTLLEENLLLIKKNKEWLAHELLKNKLLIKMVDYAYYKKNKIYFIKA